MGGSRSRFSCRQKLVVAFVVLVVASFGVVGLACSSGSEGAGSSNTSAVIVSSTSTSSAADGIDGSGEPDVKATSTTQDGSRDDRSDSTDRAAEPPATATGDGSGSRMTTATSTSAASTASTASTSSTSPTDGIIGAAGRVVNMDTNEPVSGVQVSAAGVSTTTGEDGTYTLKAGVRVGDPALAEKKGYIAAERRVGANRGDGYGKCDLELLPEDSPNAPPPPPSD